MTKKRCDLVWDCCLKIIKDNITEQAFNTWFVPTSAYSLDGDTLTLQVPSGFFYEYIESNYTDILSKVLHREIGPSAKLLYKLPIDVEAGNEGSMELPADSRSAIMDNENKKTNASEALSARNGGKSIGESFNSQLNPRYTFENFIEGLSNKLPRSVAQSVSERPGLSFNPLFMYGPSGIGKTHLANAIGVRIKEEHPEKRVLYVSAHLFQVQYTDAARKNQINDFIHFYQTIDVLILDDVQEFTGEKTQNTFFHIFNHLHQNGKQLILTSDRSPIQLKGFEDRLLTRFKWGMVTEMERPGVELRKDILRECAKKEGMVFPESVISFIAEHATQSVRDLEGIVTSINARSAVYNRPVDLALAEESMHSFCVKMKTVITQDDIINKVYDHFSVSLETMFLKSRKQELVRARQVTMYLLKELTPLSSNKIGKIVGNKDHTTVLHAIKTIKGQIDVNASFADTISQLIQELKVG